MTGRFAPTPSGRMHIGNVYAMLGAWLSARAQGEPVLLRIEDIDQPRVVAGADDSIKRDLEWLGLDWDGEPVYQSQRIARYEEALACLEAQGLLYPCFCSRSDLRAASAPQEGDGFQRYPGTCRRLLQERPEEVEARLAAGKQHSLRLAVPEHAGEDEMLSFEDAVYGTQQFDVLTEVGDCVIRRADGIFSYQLAVVVDDCDEGVDDIVRGRDLLRSTALQMLIRQRLLDGSFTPEHLGADHPHYAHLPLVTNQERRRLAKRERSLDMGALQAQGVSAEAIIGYCAWLLRVQPTPEPCQAKELVSTFSWDPLRADHDDRVMSTECPATPKWLCNALG